MTLSSRRIVIITILILVLVGGGWFLFGIMNRPERTQEDTATNKQTQTKPSSQNTAPSTLVYTHPALGFSFTYGSEMNVGHMEEGEEGEMLLIQKPGLSTLGQIYISPFPADQVLTAELITREFPRKKIANGKKVLIGGVEAFSFESEEEGIGQTWEVMYAKDGKIYQAMSVLINRGEFEAVLTTWSF